MYSLRTSFWMVPPSFSREMPRRSATLLSLYVAVADRRGISREKLGGTIQNDVQKKQRRRGGVDGHGGRDLVERQPLEENLHVLQAVDGHAHLADLAPGQVVVGIAPHLGGEVERHGQPALSLAEQIMVA